MPFSVSLIETTKNQTNYAITTCHLSSYHCHWNHLSPILIITWGQNVLQTCCLHAIYILNTSVDAHITTFELNSNFFLGKELFRFCYIDCSKERSYQRKNLMHHKQMEILKTTSIRETKATYRQCRRIKTWLVSCKILMFLVTIWIEDFLERT